MGEKSSKKNKAVLEDGQRREKRGPTTDQKGRERGKHTGMLKTKKNAEGGKTKKRRESVFQKKRPVGTGGILYIGSGLGERLKGLFCGLGEIQTSDPTQWIPS